MKHILLIPAFALAVAVQAQSDSFSQIPVTPEHSIQASKPFDPNQLELGTKLKYIGLASTATGVLLTSNGNSEVGVFAAIAGGITALVGTVIQDVQLVRLGNKHSEVEASSSAQPIPNGEILFRNERLWYDQKGQTYIGVVKKKSDDAWVKVKTASGDFELVARSAVRFDLRDLYEGLWLNDELNVISNGLVLNARVLNKKSGKIKVLIPSNGEKVWINMWEIAL